jgi:NAD+ synthase
MNRSKEIIEWIKKQVSQADKEGIVVGLSGGVDSSVVAVLAKKALGSNMLGLILPCNSNSEDGELALKVTKIFGIKTEIIPLTNIFNNLVSLYKKGSDIARANLKVRLRMTTLYYIANTLDYLVTGTGNKSELMIGYFTKYGDGGCDILPIGGLLKTEVINLAKELGIPSEIINRPPTAGLWAGQTDEGEIGMSYECLDKCLRAISNNNINKIQKGALDKTNRMIKHSAHKRQTPPIFTRI